MPLLLDAAAAAGLMIGLHIEPYDGRSAVTVKRDAEYAAKQYGAHPAFGSAIGKPGGRSGPVYYLYDSYRLPATEWAQLLKPGGKLSIRGGPADGVFLCLLLDQGHLQYAVEAGCDGLYTYL